MATDWRLAFRVQAASDFKVYQLLVRTSEVPPCHQLHYLQMATEKLAKAYTTPPGQQPKPTHRAFVRFLKVCKSRREIREAFGYRDNHLAFGAFIDSIIETAQQIEGLYPESTMSRPNPEYPWEGSEGILVPCEHDFADLNPARNVHLKELMTFVHVGFEVL